MLWVFKAAKQPGFGIPYSALDGVRNRGCQVSSSRVFPSTPRGGALSDWLPLGEYASLAENSCAGAARLGRLILADGAGPAGMLLFGNYLAQSGIGDNLGLINRLARI
jgi:hypothetical protein